MARDKYHAVSPAPGDSAADVLSEATMRALASVALIDATPSGKICFATPKAGSLLAKYTAAADRLPDKLVHALQARAVDEALLLTWGPDGQGGQLELRLTGRTDGNYQLLLEEKRHIPTIERLVQRLGVTPREAEVLLWIAKGKTAPEIAEILACKPSTVNKHTQRIFAKIAVETRTAAAAVALETLH